MKQSIRLGLGALALGVCVAAQAAAPVITNITLMGGNPQLTIQSDVGLTNEVQCNDDLTQTNWTVLTNLVVAQSPYGFVDASAVSASNRFYRVVAFPANNPVPPGMVLIPAGPFTMGNGMSPSEGSNIELPLHTNYVSAFYMDTNEVTKALWDEVYQWATNRPGDLRYSFEGGALGNAASHPVHTVSWYNMVKWCNARSEKDGRTPAYYTEAAQTNVYRTGQTNLENDWVKWTAGYRLPTEAEWEKAARGGASGHRFPWSDVDTISHSRANYIADTNSYAYDVSPTQGFHPDYDDGGLPYTSPAGSFAANGYGLYDMAGNMWEWCWDWYDSAYYSTSPATDPQGPVGPLTWRVLRGGNWGNDAYIARCAYRGAGSPSDAFSSFGFRCVRGF